MRTSIAQKAYIAGFIEGEGSFTISIRCRHVRVSVTQKNRKPLEFIQGFYGGGIGRRRLETGVYSYRLGKSHSVMRLIEDIYPFLIGSRARYRAACVYKLAALTGKLGYRLSPEVRDKKEQIYELWSRSRR